MPEVNKQSKDHSSFQDKFRCGMTEVITLTLISFGFFLWLLNIYTIRLGHADVVTWFSFGINFAEQLPKTKLGFGFPLIISLASRLFGKQNAFLVNIPILTAIIPIFYIFARSHIPGTSTTRFRRIICGLVAIMAFIHLNRHEFSSLCNPLRDPLSWLLVLSACLALIAFQTNHKHPVYVLIVCAFCLAYATATRETSVLMLLPFLIYAVTAKLEDKTLPFWRPAIVFIIICALAAIPYMIQNYHTTGCAFTPGQLALQGGFQGSFKNFIHNNNKILTFLVQHYEFLSLFFVIGVIHSIRHKNTQALSLTLPAAICFYLFYASYMDREIWRYLMVIDFFVLPIVGIGVVSTIDFVTSRIPLLRQIDDIRIPAIVSGIIFISTMALFLNSGPRPENPCKITDVRSFTRDLQNQIPPSSTVFTEGGQLYNAVKFFTNIEPVEISPENIDPLHAFNTSWSWRAYLLATSDAMLRAVQREHDTRNIFTFHDANYALRPLLGRPDLSIYEISPWTALSSSTTNITTRQGAHILRIDVGNISKYDRTISSILLNGKTLSTTPCSYLNYFMVDIESAPYTNVTTLSSDQPVDRNFTTEISPIDDPLHLEFKPDQLHLYAGVMGNIPLEKRSHYPSIKQGIDISLPVFAKKDEIILIDANIQQSGMDSDNPVQPPLINENQIDSNACVNIDPSHLVAGFNGNIAASPFLNYRLRPFITPFSSTLNPLLKGVTIYRYPLTDQHIILPGTKSQNYAGIQGIHSPDVAFTEEELSWCWTKAKVSALIILRKSDKPTIFSVKYFDANRPDSALPPAPEFRVNGLRQNAETTESFTNSMKFVSASFTVPPEAITSDISKLEIICNTWKPCDFNINSDTRELGIMLNSITATRR